MQLVTLPCTLCTHITIVTVGISDLQDEIWPMTIYSRSVKLAYNSRHQHTSLTSISWKCYLHFSVSTPQPKYRFNVQQIHLMQSLLDSYIVGYTCMGYFLSKIIVHLYLTRPTASGLLRA
jgi:hypothetical protein